METIEFIVVVMVTVFRLVVAKGRVPGEEKLQMWIDGKEMEQFVGE